MISNKEVKQDRDYDIRKCFNMMKDESNITEQKFKEFTAQLDILQSELSESIVARNKDYNQTVKELEQIDRRFEIFSDYKNIRSAVESMQKEIASKQTLDDTTNMVSERSSKTKPKTRAESKEKVQQGEAGEKQSKSAGGGQKAKQQAEQDEDKKQSNTESKR